jgi:hypothetical protein
MGKAGFVPPSKGLLKPQECQLHKFEVAVVRQGLVRYGCSETLSGTLINFQLLTTPPYSPQMPSFRFYLFLFSSLTSFPINAPGYIAVNRHPPRPYSDDTKKFFIPTFGAAGLVLCLHLT